MATIALLGTLDTKGAEFAFIADQIRSRGYATLLIDVGTSSDEPQVTPDISRSEVAEGVNFAELDRGAAVEAMSNAIPALVERLAAEKKIDGVISLGGGGGTAIATSAMRALPVGFPKVMISTVAGGNAGAYIGVKDIVLFPSIVDVAGINRISREIFSRAAGAVCGMVATEVPSGKDRPLIAASMFGNTTACVQAARLILEDAGYEVLVFHSTGSGGRTMESLIDSGMIAGVLDVTTTEWADELGGGVFNAGPYRLEGAARNGVPAIVTPGCLDMVNFNEPETVPDRYKGRTFYPHNPQVTLMRTNPDECAELGRILAEKVNLSTGPVTVLLPLKAISVISAEGQPFHDPAADAVLFEAIRSNLQEEIRLVEIDCTINDPEFACACAEALLENLNE